MLFRVSKEWWINLDRVTRVRFMSLSKGERMAFLDIPDTNEVEVCGKYAQNLYKYLKTDKRQEYLKVDNRRYTVCVLNSKGEHRIYICSAETVMRMSYRLLRDGLNEDQSVSVTASHRIVEELLAWKEENAVPEETRGVKR